MSICFTVGGDRIEYDGNVSTPGADLTTVKCLLNSIISTADARFMMMDIKDFYLNNPMEQYEYKHIPVLTSPNASWNITNLPLLSIMRTYLSKSE